MSATAPERSPRAWSPASARTRSRWTIRATHSVPPPQPRLVVAQALPKGDRGELAVELMTEVGVDAVVPWSAERSITKWQAEPGSARPGQVARDRPRGRQAVPTGLAARDRRARHHGYPRAAGRGRGAGDRPGSGREAKLHELALPETGDILLLVGPEGGISPGRARRPRRGGRDRGPARPDGAAHLHGRRGGGGSPAQPHARW